LRKQHTPGAPVLSLQQNQIHYRRDLSNGDGVRLNRSSETTGTDDSWLPCGARSFRFFAPIGAVFLAGKRRIGAHLRLFLIAVFGAIGTLARYGLQGLVQIRTGSTFPYGTLLINLTGCFLLAILYQSTLNRLVISPDLRVAIGVGFFGGYTTFSSFGWETAKLLEDGEWFRATTYVTASVVAGILLSVAGIRLANRF
jgi:CrcB protein